MTIEEPLFSIWVLAYGPQAYLLSLTLDNLENQIFQDYEILIADAREEKKEISETRAVIVEMPATTMPQAMTKLLLEKSKGRYVHILKAGEYYLASHGLEWLAEKLNQENYPELLCTGFIRHHSLSPSEFHYYPLSKKNLLQGRFPAQAACVLQRKIFLTHPPAPTFRDLLCEFLESGQRTAFLDRIIVDYIYQVPSPKRAIAQVAETGKVLLRHYGPRPAFALWSCRVACHFVCWWFARIKKMFHPIA